MREGLGEVHLLLGVWRACTQGTRGAQRYCKKIPCNAIPLFTLPAGPHLTLTRQSPTLGLKTSLRRCLLRGKTRVMRQCQSKEGRVRKRRLRRCTLTVC